MTDKLKKEFDKADFVALTLDETSDVLLSAFYNYIHFIDYDDNAQK